MCIYIIQKMYTEIKQTWQLVKQVNLYQGSVRVPYNISAGFPGGTVVMNLPANAGDTGSSPGPGRSHMPQSNQAREPQLLSLRSRAREPQPLSPRAQSSCSATREATTMRSLRTATEEQPPLAAARESANTATKAQCSQK